MNKRLGLALSAVGAFLVVAALLAQTYAASALMKVPLDTDTTTTLSGTVTSGGETFDVVAYSITHIDSAKSDGQVASWQNFGCLVKDVGDVEGCVSAEPPEDRLVTASESFFATDRTTGLAVGDPKYTPAGATPREGLSNKWPFQAEEKDYPYWDSVLQRAVVATFDKKTEADGMTVNVYKVSIDNEPAEISAGVEGTYSDEKEIWVEPLTGAIVNQIDSQQRVDSEGNPFIEINVAFTDEQVKDDMETAKSNASSLNLIRKVIPLVGYILGIPLLMVGLFLLWSSVNGSPSSRSGRRGPETDTF